VVVRVSCNHASNGVDDEDASSSAFSALRFNRDSPSSSSSDG